MCRFFFASALFIFLRGGIFVLLRGVYLVVCVALEDEKGQNIHIGVGSSEGRDV